MKLLILSGLHTEFADFVPEAGVDFDICVLAGDIATKGRAGAWAAKAFVGKPVVLVLGNHDYWEPTWPRLWPKRARTAWIRKSTCCTTTPSSSTACVLSAARSGPTIG